MAKKRPRSPAGERREDALSRERIVEAAVQMLDVEGESGLTFRALAAHLQTGPGAIYWHVSNKTELLASAATSVLAGAMAVDVASDAPEKAIRTVALDVFDAIDAHPWLGTQLSLAPSQPPMLDIFERIGRQMNALGVPVKELFMTTSALTNYILGVGGQNAANARAASPDTTRDAFLESIATTWENLDPDAYPFARKAAAQLRDHDDRAQFLAGIDLFLAGIRARWGASTKPKRR